MGNGCERQRLKIAILHPDLGIGGAERLIVDAAVQLQAAGHRVTIFTSHHDPAHCFAPTADGTLEVRVFGAFLPSHVARHLRAPCAVTKMLYSVGRRPATPVRRLPLRLGGARDPGAQAGSTRTPVVFYCHFPDLLLVPRERSAVRPLSPANRSSRAMGHGVRRSRPGQQPVYGGDVRGKRFPDGAGAPPRSFTRGGRLPMATRRPLGGGTAGNVAAVTAGHRALSSIQEDRSRGRSPGALSANECPAPRFERGAPVIAGHYDEGCHEHGG